MPKLPNVPPIQSSATDSIVSGSTTMASIYLIKDLAQISGLSIDTVKYYLKLGLIKEVQRSPTTNFRYFDDSTVKKLAKIRELRKRSVPLMQIKDTLDNQT